MVSNMYALLLNARSRLESNQIRDIHPESFGHLKNLQSLWLRDNNLTHIPDAVNQCPSLKAM